YQQEALRNAEDDRKHHLEQLIREETEYQRREYDNDLSRMLQGITSASPSFIAEYRMNGPLKANDDLIFENCPICISNFQVNRCYSRWPCEAGHIFHFNCMLGVLRTGNKCPLCRHPVESADLPNMNFILELMLR
ncbi:unnamed protein product, partial [Rotaria sp. Silwood2]